ncbi:MAG: component of the polarisome [Peltula sp. TS41687]|nr:MAG: component of the polarisome [Peltula sp. TS41687]
MKSTLTKLWTNRAMNGRAGTLSPVSAEGSDWSGISRYQTLRNGDPVNALPTSNQRAALVTAPGSNGTTTAYNDGATSGGLGSRGRGGNNSGNPSPPSSVNRSSDGNGLSSSDEESLLEHYVALKRFLANFLRDEKGNPRSNRAKDKLLRLSAVQFHELSTDVYDELLRRQSASGARRSGPGGLVQEGAPPFLMPEDNFHPKRNQARQKLSTLPPNRFRDLATDVFFESERRFPGFTGADPEGGHSGASSTMSGMGPNLIPTAGGGALSRPGSRGQLPRFADGLGQNPPYEDKPAFSAQAPEYGRPMPKTFQSNTIIPIKSTMIENDDDAASAVSPIDSSQYEDAYGLGTRRMSKRPTERSPIESQETSADNQAQVRQLQNKISELESRLGKQDEDLISFEQSDKDRRDALDRERRDWSDLRASLERKLGEARTLNDSLQSELDKLRAVNGGLERDLYSQRHQVKGGLDKDDSELRRQYEALQRHNEELNRTLQDQQQVTEEVRREATTFLQEMKSLSDQYGRSWDKEEALGSRVAQLEKEVDIWKNRYARTKAQSRNLRVSSVGLPIRPPEVGEYSKDDRFVSDDGRVRDVFVIKFQIAIDELLQLARNDDPSAIHKCMRSVIGCTRRIMQDVGEAPPGTGDLATQLPKLKGYVTAYSSNLINVCKTFTDSNGITPVSMLDVAATHLTASIIEVIQLVKIRPSPAGDLDVEDNESILNGTTPLAFSPVPNGRFSGESVYSSATVPTRDTLKGSANTERRNWFPTQPAEATISSGDQQRRDVSSFGHDSSRREVQELKMYLEDQVEELVQWIQALVNSIRTNAGLAIIRDYISDIAGIVANIVSWTSTAIEEARNPSLRAALREQGQPVISKLCDCRALLLNANIEGERINDPSMLKDFTNKLPPLAFEIGRETRQLIQRIDQVDLDNRDNVEKDRFR